MEYRHSVEYLQMRKNGPRRMVIMLTSVMAFLGFLTFVGPAPAPDVADAIGPFVITLLIVIAIGAFQVRAARRAIAELSTIRFELSNAGINYSSSAGQRFLKYEVIKEIRAFRPWTKRDPRIVHFKTTEGDLGVAGLENLASFLDEVRRHSPNARYREERSVFV